MIDASGMHVTTPRYRAIHQDQEIRRRAERTGEWDQDAIITAAPGLAFVGVIFFFRIRR